MQDFGLNGLRYSFGSPRVRCTQIHSMCFGLGRDFRVWGLGFREKGFGFRVQGAGLYDIVLQVWDA